MLEINANTRAINIKDTTFNSTGISVQGDEVAEIIFFCIDRYFDATDLGHEDMNIVIQWKHVSNGEQGVTNSFIRDIESQPGKVIFGWPIGSEITSTPGKIQFSVRFYKTAVDTSTNKKYITYSFNTLPQTAVINASLNYITGIEGEIPADDHSSLILDRIVASESDGSAGQDALAPVFHPEWNLPVISDLDVNGMLKLYVQAYSEDGGTVSYDWRQEDGTATGSTVEGHVVYELTTDTVAQPNNVYYKKYTDMDGLEAYAAITIQEGQEFPDKSNTYERFSTYTITAVGSYFCKATNTLGKKKESTKSIVCTIPEPQDPVVAPPFVDGSVERVILTLDEATGTYGGEISVTATGDSDGKSTLTYQWLQDGNAVPGGTEASYQISGQNAKFNSIYQAVVTNHRNKASHETSSARFRVSAPAQPAIISYPSAPVLVTLSPSVTSTYISVQVDTSENSPLSDGYTCTWYRCQDQLTYQPGPNDTIYGTPNIPMTDGTAQMLVSIATHPGHVVYAKIRNTVNGDTIEVNSPTFDINTIGT